MLRYFFHRLLLSLPTLIIISMLIFGLNRCSTNIAIDEGTTDPEEEIAQYRRAAHQLGVDLPTFYLTVQSGIFPDTLYRVFPPDRRERLCRLTADCGSWSAAASLERSLWQALRMVHQLSPASRYGTDLHLVLDAMRVSRSRDELAAAMRALHPASDSLGKQVPDWLAVAADVERSAQAVLRGQAAAPWALPSVHWYGTANGYHRWMSGLLRRGELGSSRMSLYPVWTELRPLLASTLLLNCSALLLSYLIAVPVGVLMAWRQGRRTDHWGKRTLLLLYAVPMFWLGGILMLVFASPVIFQPPPISGAYIPPWRGSGLSLFGWFWTYAERFVLPIVTITLHTLAYLALQMRGAMLEALGHDYIRTARAKGLPEKKVYWRHAFRNALFPLITSFASLFPGVFAGSLVVEYLFGYPGVGKRTQEAFLNSDEPVLLGILMLSAVLTVASMLIADILYARADPRVKFRR